MARHRQQWHRRICDSVGQRHTGGHEEQIAYLLIGFCPAVKVWGFAGAIGSKPQQWATNMVLMTGQHRIYYSSQPREGLYAGIVENMDCDRGARVT